MWDEVVRDEEGFDVFVNAIVGEPIEYDPDFDFDDETKAYLINLAKEV